MYPASILVSLTIFAVGCAVLWRRGAKVAAVVWGAAWFVANAVEVGVKAAIERPALHATKDGVSYHLASFDHSFPSGHAMRAVLVAAVVLYVWRRLGVVAAVWALALPFCLVAASWHVPSDVVGGVLFGCLAALTAVATIVGRLGAPRRVVSAPDVAALLASVEAGELGDPLPVLAYVAGLGVELPEDELARARRRSLLVLAAGGDPHRELEVDAPAVKSLAADLFEEERRAQLAAAIDELAVAARDLPLTREALLFLAADVDLAWRLLALALLAEEIGATTMLSPRDSEPEPAADACLKSGTSIE